MPTIETKTTPRRKVNTFNSTQHHGQHDVSSLFPLSIFRSLTRRVLVGVVEVLVDLHGVVALQSVTVITGQKEGQTTEEVRGKVRLVRGECLA